MAASRALFDLQCHVNRAGGRPPGAHPGYQPEPLLKSIRNLGSESRQVRHMTAGALLASRLSLSDAEHSAVLEHLVPEGRRAKQPDVPSEQPYPGAPDRKIAAPTHLLTRARSGESAAWVSDEQSEVSQSGRCTTASAWLRTDAPIELIAPKLDPQNWDAAGSFIEEAFGISPSTVCATTHTKVLLGDEGYEDQRLHEQVRASLGPLSEGLACDLNVSFRQDFDSPVPNHALYELVCDHKGWIDRNEGHCYVREVEPGLRLLFASKHLCFNEHAPPLLSIVAPLVLPVWLRLILATAIP